MIKGDISQDALAADVLKPVGASSAVRILVADDDQQVLRLCSVVLGRVGFQTETAEDGLIAWKKLQAQAFDMLITDHEMPEISGTELVKRVRAARMALPVILTSGSREAGEWDAQPWLPPFASLAKPFSATQLVTKVNLVLALPPAQPPPL